MTDSQQNIRLTARVGYEPHFSWSYLKPKYWGIWLGILVLLLLAFIPFRLRDKFAAKIGLLVGHKAKNNVNALKLICNIAFRNGRNNTAKGD